MLLSRWVGIIVAFLVQCVISVSSPAPLSVTPSVQWYGDDGDWSAVSIRIGTPPQWVDVMVSTVSSETWVVGRGGCSAIASDCITARGGTFNQRDSTTWHSQGLFDLGADKHLGNTGYAEYGLDNLTFGTTGVSLPNAIIGSFNYTGLVNSTQYLLGFFGLGVVPGSFNNTQIPSALSGLLEKEGTIPSHSYGYTAGASYQAKGVPNSLTLGGYDTNRFVPNNVSFALNPSQNPEVYINSVIVQNSTMSRDLVNSADRVSAVIDSSTPYLWLPKAACDRFANTLGLVYDESLNLYTFSANTSQHAVLQNSSLVFAFSLSDIAASPSQVTIKLPYDAFDLELSYPAIPGTTFGAANATKRYFPLRQAASLDQYTIGRAFLQEAYIITDYERSSFSLHQSKYTSSPVQDTAIVAITRPVNSNLSGGPDKPKSMKISTGAIVGIAIAAVALVAFLTVAIFFWRRRMRNKVVDDEKTPVVESRSFMDWLRRRKEPLAHEASGDNSYPTEVGADATHERFELPAPIGPVELDSEYGTTFGGTTENGSTQDTNTVSAYERARRKLERQQITAAQAQRNMATYPAEKTENDDSEIPHYRAPENEIPDIDTPLVSPVGPDSAGSLTLSNNGSSSPVSPGFMDTPVSPLTAAPPTYSRISPSHVIYAGRLPDAIELPRVVPRIIGPDGRSIPSNQSLSSDPDPESSLGSQSSDELYLASPVREINSGLRPQADEERYVPNLRADAQVQDILAPWGSRRRLDGEDIVHIPQPAENRFSWEEERTEGLD